MPVKKKILDGLVFLIVQSAKIFLFFGSAEKPVVMQIYVGSLLLDFR